MLIPNPEIIGITEKEARLYEILLNLGEQDAARLINESGFKRPTVYKSLYSMAEKGLITEIEKDGKSYFRPEPPQKLLEVAEEQYNRLNRARGDISSLLPELVSAFTLSTERPVVTTFTGIEGLKKIYEDTLKEGKTIYALLKLVKVNPELQEWLEKDYVKRRVAKGIHAEVIVARQDYHEYIANAPKSERTLRVVPYDQFPIEHEVGIYGDKVAFIDYSEGSQLVGVIISHPLIARTCKAWFDLAWKAAEEVDQ